MDQYYTTFGHVVTLLLGIPGSILAVLWAFIWIVDRFLIETKTVRHVVRFALFYGGLRKRGMSRGDIQKVLAEAMGIIEKRPTD